MKKVFVQIGKAVCYFLVYFGMQCIFSVMLSVYHSVMIGIEMAMNGTIKEGEQMSPELANQVTELLMERVMDSAGVLVIVSGFATILTLWLFFRIRRKKFFAEAEIVPFEKKQWIPVIGMGLGIAFFCNGGLSLLPIPEEIMQSYAESSSSLFEQPIWVAILSNVIAAPLVEEIIFRGLMNTRLRKAMPTALAVVITSVMFGLMHGHILWASYAAMMGILFAIIAIQCRSTFASIMVHLIVNLVGTILSYAGWNPSVEGLAVMCGVGFVLLAVSLVMLFRKEETAQTA